MLKDEAKKIMQLGQRFITTEWIYFFHVMILLDWFYFCLFIFEQRGGIDC